MTHWSNASIASWESTITEENKVLRAEVEALRAERKKLLEQIHSLQRSRWKEADVFRKASNAI